MFVAKKFVNHLHFSSFLDIFLSFSVIFLTSRRFCTAVGFSIFVEGILKVCKKFVFKHFNK